MIYKLAAVLVLLLAFGLSYLIGACLPDTDAGVVISMLIGIVLGVAGAATAVKLWEEGNLR